MGRLGKKRREGGGRGKMGSKETREGFGGGKTGPRVGFARFMVIRGIIGGNR